MVSFKEYYLTESLVDFDDDIIKFIKEKNFQQAMEIYKRKAPRDTTQSLRTLKTKVSGIFSDASKDIKTPVYKAAAERIKNELSKSQIEEFIDFLMKHASEKETKSSGTFVGGRNVSGQEEKALERRELVSALKQEKSGQTSGRAPETNVFADIKKRLAQAKSASYRVKSAIDKIKTQRVVNFSFYNFTPQTATAFVKEFNKGNFISAVKAVNSQDEKNEVPFEDFKKKFEEIIKYGVLGNKPSFPYMYLRDHLEKERLASFYKSFTLKNPTTFYVPQDLVSLMQKVKEHLQTLDDLAVNVSPRSKEGVEKEVKKVDNVMNPHKIDMSRNDRSRQEELVEKIDQIIQNKMNFEDTLRSLKEVENFYEDLAEDERTTQTSKYSKRAYRAETNTPDMKENRADSSRYTGTKQAKAGFVDKQETEFQKSSRERSEGISGMRKKVDDVYSRMQEARNSIPKEGKEEFNAAAIELAKMKSDYFLSNINDNDPQAQGKKRRVEDAVEKAKQLLTKYGK